MGSDDLTPSSHIDKLKQITERMLSFDQMLQTEAQSRNSRLDDVSKKYDLCLDAVQKLEESVDAVIQRQSNMMDSALHKVEMELRDYRIKIDEWLQSRTRETSSQIRELEEKMSTIESELGNCDINSIRRVLDNYELTAKVSELEARRVESEEDITRTYKNTTMKIDDLIEREKNKFEEKISLLSSKFDERQWEETETIEKYRLFFMDKIDQLRAAIAKESAARISSDDEIVEALNTYTSSLQKALSLVAKNS